MLTRNEGSPRALSRGFFAGGIICLVLTAATNYFQGDQLAVTTAGRWLSSASSVVVDIVGLVMFGLAAGSCFARRRWAPAILFSAIMIASAVWSTVAMVSFQATERISASASREKAINRIDDIDNFSKGQSTWFRGQALKADSRVERRDFLRASSDEIKRLRDVETKTFILPDAGAKVISDITGYRINTVQISMVSYLAMLLILLQAMSFPASAFFGELAHSSGPPKGKASSGGGNEDKGNITSFPVKDQPKPAALKASAANSNTNTPERSGTAREAPSSVAYPGALARRSLPMLPKPSRPDPVDEVLQRLLARTHKLESQSQGWKLAGVSKGQFSKLMAKAEKRGQITRSRHGNRKTVRIRMGDGGGRQALAIG